jgi:DNA topoisomerase-1
MAKRKADKRALVIVESPAKAKTINKYLGDEFIVRASLGHVRDLPPKDFGIDVSSDFKPTYEVVRGRVKVVSELRKLAGHVDEVYLATDPDREGEAIAWHLVEALKLDPDKVRRVIFNEITRAAISEAFQHPHEIDLDRVNAQQARRILDRIVGYELSPLLWKKIARGLSAGRVQSVAVRLIVERERQIRAFTPEESWKIAAFLTPDEGALAQMRQDWSDFVKGERSQKEIQAWLGAHGCFRTELAEVGGKPFKAGQVDEARAVAEALGFSVSRVERQPWAEYEHLKLEQITLRGELATGQVPRFTLADLKSRRATTRPAAPFTTATLQQTASNVLRFSASRTMRTAQALYEGVDLNGEGTVGLITYMRTDSTNLAAEAVSGAWSFIQENFGERYLPQAPNVYGKRQARAQEAHEAIRPTDPHRTPESVRNALSPEQFKLYDLIWKRFIACQMSPAEWDATAVTVTCDTRLGAARFAGSGRKLVFDGFMRIAGVTSEDQILPVMTPGQPIGLLGLDPKQSFTLPPARYTEASLVKAMEGEGIGRPSTYAAIIDTIQDRGYVEQVERKFYPTSLGELVTDKLVEHFPKIMDVKFTSYMEDELDKIEDAHLDWVQVLHEFYDPFRELLGKAAEEMQAARSQPSEHTCPSCNAPMVYRWSRTGRFLACSNYPKCKATMNVDRAGHPMVPETTEHVCELCGQPMLLRQSKTGFFLGCGGYPECRNTIPCDDKGQPLRLVTEKELERPCEACGQGTMVVKRKGPRRFLGCNRFPECKNLAPLPLDVRLEKKPAPPPEEAGINCDRCGRPMVIRSGRRGKFIACSGYPRCRNTKPFERLEELRAAVAAGANDGRTGHAPRGGEPASSEASAAATNGGSGTGDPHPQFGTPPPGFAWTRTGRPVVEVMPAAGTLHCPQCGSTMELKRSRFGPFFSCSNYPKCKFNANLRGEAKKEGEERLPAPARPKAVRTDIPCPECGAPLVVRVGRRGKFLGCSNYPKCRAAQELPPGFDLAAATAAAATSD